MDNPALHIIPFSSRPEDEGLLLNQFLKGDDVAFTILYNRYVNELLSYGKGLGFDSDGLKDVIHDIFCKLYVDRKLVKNIGNFKSYLFRALKNHLLNDLQKDTRNRPLEQGENDFLVKVTVLDEIIEAEDRFQIQATLDKCLSCLTGRQKEAIYLRFIQEMEYKEIGVLLDMTEHGARKLISRSLLRIRKQQIPFSFLVLYVIRFFGKK